MSVEYRVIWKREGVPEKRKRYRLLKHAENRVLLLGPTPWMAFNKFATDPECCDGRECGCEGRTIREALLKGREGLPPIEYIRMERREFTRAQGPWSNVLSEGKSAANNSTEG